MATHQKLRLSSFWWAGGLTEVLFLVYGSLEPAWSASAGSLFLLNDKVLHVAAYLAVASWFMGIVEPSRYRLVAIALFVLGDTLEFAQWFMRLGRLAEWGDVAANTLGIATALVLAYAGLGSWMVRVEQRFHL
ncbi:MAG: hypothetical protein HYV55_00910 [Parcubacteria group bacterium]|nr:hypothetical protein [Parcubacteria group bacterium]